MKRFRISAISYLNTAPLMWDFEHGDAASAFDISYTLPSGCAADLRDGLADIGIIPAAAYASIPDLAVIPGVAIASRHAVRSILLVSKLPLGKTSLGKTSLDKVRTVALDNSSMTSVALTKVLFAKWWGGERIYSTAEPDIETMLAQHDAALVIGDPALKIDRSRFQTLDLAEEWTRFTGQPFVFAFWAVRKAALQDAPPELDLAAIFRDSRDHGLAPDNLRTTSKLWASRLSLSERDVKSYLTHSMHYQLDPACLGGLQSFYRYAEECGALPLVPGLRFLDASKPVAI